MNKIDYEILLEDRIYKIQSINKQYDLENNAYLSFSGGKDSTVLHYLLDMALPNNNIPRVFINTGIEYLDIVKYVKELAKNDDRFVLVAPSKNIKNTLNEYGYPFKSKEHSQRLYEFQHRGYINNNTIDKYLSGNFFSTCPKILRYQFSNKFDIKVSHLCCKKLKKEPFDIWQKENDRSIAITGMLREEGGNRTQLNCIITKNDKIIKFHPLSVITNDWEKWFIDKFDIKLCKLYYPPYNFTRTGCKGCPFSLTLQQDLDTMEKLLPNEKKQCENIWSPVYTEYRRLGYRLRKYGTIKQSTIYDYIKEC